MALGGVVGGDELAAASATAVGLLREAESLRAEAVSLLVEFDDADGHVELGFVSPQRHLAFEAKLTNDDADRLVRAIRHCGRHTLTADALAAGSITVGMSTYWLGCPAGSRSSFPNPSTNCYPWPTDETLAVSSGW